MTSLQLIDILLCNGTNLEQSGRIAAGADIFGVFGNRTRRICGDLDEQFVYFYVYLNPLDSPCDCVLMDDEEQLIYLYKIEGV